MLRKIGLLSYIIFALSTHLAVAAPTCSEIFDFDSESLKVSVHSDHYNTHINLSNPNPQIASLMDAQGNLYLFRSNVGPHIPNVAGSYTVKEGGVSTSLSPSIFAWQGSKPEAHILIIKQNINSDLLSYPGPGGIYENRMPLTSRTRFSDIAFYSEVKVPLEKLNVIKQIKTTRYVEILKEIEGQSLTMEQFVNRLLQEPDKN